MELGSKILKTLMLLHQRTTKIFNQVPITKTWM